MAEKNEVLPGLVGPYSISKVWGVTACVVDANGFEIGTIIPLAAAQSLVLILNSHAQCVEALKESIQYSPYKGESEETGFLRRARAALKLAEGVEHG